MSTTDEILELIKQENPANPMSYVRSIVQDYAIKKLNDSIMHCKDCPNLNHNVKTGFSGNYNATVMMIGDFVFDTEKKDTYNHFSNDAKNILDLCFENFNINENELCCINALSCMCYKKAGDAPYRRTPNLAEVKNCFSYIKQAIDIVRPKLILLFGNIALNIFKQENITKARGHWIDIFGIQAMPTYHPGYFAELEDKKSRTEIEALEWDFYNDLEKAFKYIKEIDPDSNLFLEKCGD